MKRNRSRSGFTLLELLMVVIIIGILASLAVPQYLKTTEKARMGEALSMLGALRGSAVRYVAENGVAPPDGGPITVLDVDPATAAGTPNFTYSITGSGAGPVYVIRALRTTPPAVGHSQTANSTSTREASKVALFLDSMLKIVCNPAIRSLRNARFARAVVRHRCCVSIAASWLASARRTS